eukprot:5786174-Pleurochrysis_carterae.AAC.1
MKQHLTMRVCRLAPFGSSRRRRCRRSSGRKRTSSSCSCSAARSHSAGARVTATMHARSCEHVASCKMERARMSSHWAGCLHLGSLIYRRGEAMVLSSVVGGDEARLGDTFVSSSGKRGVYK